MPGRYQNGCSLGTIQAKESFKGNGFEFGEHRGLNLAPNGFADCTERPDKKTS
jgi:hypothetical protein